MVAVLAVTLAAPLPPATPQAQTPALQMPPDCFGRLTKAGSSVFNDTPCASPLLPAAGAFSSYRSESAGSQAEAQAFSSADATGFYMRARRRSESWPERGETNGVLVCQEERLSAAAHQHVHAPPLTRIGSCDSIIRTTDASAPNTPTHKPGHRSQLVRSLHKGSVQKVQAQHAAVNPLKPCGACTEWLRKIAEVNPDFKVLTFTDTTCEGVYIESVTSS
ncbi:A distinct subfamily of CDD/CDA-like deaminases-domain-containing protein [Tribonema minus]|nr:A distinct subfamily of CDD/CDA-like deaminases-domain-containing protein [Tribonema minus]